jgi:diguanylate cyclase (GGDEF)-like protein/PAS domain S-box-containing protein
LGKPENGSLAITKKVSPPIPLKRYTWLLAVVWTGIIVASLLWDMTQRRTEMLDIARTNAAVSLEKDMLYRKWVAEKGGVYVPITDQTPPNPHLNVLNRDVTTTSGLSLTLINPAYMTRQVNNMAKELPGGRGHLTSLQPIRPENLPDAWEREALKAFEKGAPEVSSLATLHDEEYLRLMRPFKVDKGCLKCHAGQGYQIGDIRGGISISIAMKPLRDIYRYSITRIAIAHSLLWIMGLLGICFGADRLIRQVHQREATEKVLRDTEERFKDLFDNMSSGVAVYGAVDDGKDFVFKNFNQAGENIDGISRNEIIGKSLLSVFPGTKDFGLLDVLYRVWQTGNPEHVPVALYEDENKVGWREYFVYRLSSGEVVAVYDDVTERKRAEEALEKEKEKFFTLSENAPFGLVMIDNEGKFIYLNPKFKEVFGYGLEEIKDGRKWFRLAYPDPEYRHSVIEAWLSDQKEKGAHQKRARVFAVTCKNGKKKMINFISVQLLTGETVMSCEDITEILLTEKLINEQLQFLQKLIDTVPAPVFYKDRQGIYRGCNQAYLTYMGLPREAIVGKTVYEVHPKEQADVYFRTDQELFETTGVQTYETLIRYADGALHNVIYSKGTYINAEGNIDGLIGIILDITDRKKMEERLERMAVVDELTGLYNRRGFLTLAQQQLKLAERTKEGMMLFFVDLDGMKWINDTLGHQEGDKALIEVAAALKETFRESDIVGRLGGDEFAVLALRTSDETKESLATRLDEILRTHNMSEGRTYSLSLSVGITYYDPASPLTLDELMTQADTLMYAEKKRKGLHRGLL